MAEKEAQNFQGIKIRSWAIPLVIFCVSSLGGLWWTLDQGQRSAAKDFSEFKAAFQTSTAVYETQMKTVNNTLKRLENRIDVDNQTRYTVGEARRDFALVERKLDDHEVRIRALEKKERP